MSLPPSTEERLPEIVNTEIYSGKPKGPDNAGGSYELQVVALVFLRCLRKFHDFKLTSEKPSHNPPDEREGGSLDDIVVKWGDDSYALYVQLKHKTGELLELKETHFFGGTKTNIKKGFNIKSYYETFLKIKEDLRSKQYALVLSTNSKLHENAREFFTESKTNTITGLLHADGKVFQLNGNNGKVKNTVNDREFMEHFFLFFGQNDDTIIRKDIDNELGLLLGPMDSYDTVFRELIDSVKDWKFHDKKQSTQEPLDCTWSKWGDIVRRHIAREDMYCCSCFKTTVESWNVDDTREHIESANPAYVKPYSAGTMPLSVTKVHQAICKDTHILVNVKRLKESLERGLPPWGPSIRWLVLVVDDPKETQESSKLINMLTGQLKDERRLVVVTMADKGSFGTHSGVVTSSMTDGKTSDLDSKLKNLHLS